MKIKYAILPVLSLLAVSSVFAKTPVTGDINIKPVGLMTMEDGGVSYGVTLEDLNSGENCDNSSQTCLLEGFSWSDVLGWTVWDGNILQTELGGPASFPNHYVAKSTYKGNFNGFVWGEHMGWVQLSSCAGETDSVACNAKSSCTWTGSYCDVDKDANPFPAESQTVSDWGVYVEFCPLKTTQATCEAVAPGDGPYDTDSYCNWDATDNVCVFDNIASPNGQPLRGFAWSEKLGWIKFGPQFGDTGFNGAFTNWFPDLTPPVPNILNPNNTWIPAENADKSIEWPAFAKENDSQIDPASFIIATKDTGANFVGCDAFLDGPGDTQAASSPIQQVGGNINLVFDHIGEVGIPGADRPLYGFCKYELGGVLYNGSGFGYYFGPEGQAQAISDLGTTVGIEPNVYEPNPVTLFVRAGEFDDSKSLYGQFFWTDPPIADGSSVVTYAYLPLDGASNALIDVEADINGNPTAAEASWVRNVSSSSHYSDNSGSYTFDVVDPTMNIGMSPPVTIGGGSYGFGSELDYPNTSPDYIPGVVPDSFGIYYDNVVGFAPTVGGNTLSLEDINFVTADEVLPPLEPGGSNRDTSVNYMLSDYAAPLPYNFAFAPALNVVDGSLDSDFLVIGQPVQATFSVENVSPNMDLVEFALDHLLAFEGTEAPLLEMRSVDIEPPVSPSTRTDPNSSNTRYQTITSDTALQGNQNNEFHDSSSDFHTPAINFIDLDAINGVGIIGDGSYAVDGTDYVSADDPCLEEPPCPDIYIDRNDSLGFALGSLAGTTDYTLNLTPGQIIGQGLSGSNATFGMEQYLAYNPENVLAVLGINAFNVYPAPVFIEDVEVKSIGLGTSGVVSGGQVFETVGGRDLETITTTSSTDLRREIRRNVATLTRNLDIENNCSGDRTLTSLPTDDSDACVIVDDVNGTIIAVYGDDPNTLGQDLITLGGSGNITIPVGYRYTLIITGGANLYLTENLLYPNDNTTSFGMIVMQDADGNGGNVYMNPAPTNVVGLLYAEGSLLSSPDGGSTLYYGTAGGNANDLKNQLFWQGSIASRNTIGGAPNSIIPDGVDCGPWGSDALSCAQAYDLDFTRRFTVIHDDNSNIDFAPSGYVFSGGGQCIPGSAPAPGCAHGALGASLSTVTLTGDSIDVGNSKSLDTFFIERDNRPVPPGFSSSGGLTSSQEVR